MSGAHGASPAEISSMLGAPEIEPCGPSVKAASIAARHTVIGGHIMCVHEDRRRVPCINRRALTGRVPFRRAGRNTWCRQSVEEIPSSLVWTFSSIDKLDQHREDDSFSSK